MSLKLPPANQMRPVFLLVLLIPLIFGPMIIQMINNRSADYPPHINFALQMQAGEISPIPHPMYHIGLLATAAVLGGISAGQAGLLFALLMYMLLGVVIYAGYLRPALPSGTNWRTTLLGAGLTLGLMLLSAITVFTWGQQNLYLGYFMANIYHNPTQLTLGPLALLLFIYVLGVFSTHPHYSSVTGIVIAAMVTIGTTLSKPSYIICVIPVLGLVTLYRLYRREHINWPLLIAGIAVPAGLLLIAQFTLLPHWNEFAATPDEGVIILAPLAVYEALGVLDWLLPLRLLMSILFPLAVCVVYFQRARLTLSLNLAWGMFIVGAAYAYLVAESGERLRHGNFIWSAHITILVLFVVTLAFFLRQIYDRETGFRLRRADWLCVAIFGLHVACGLLWFGHEITIGDAGRWW